LYDHLVHIGLEHWGRDRKIYDYLAGPHTKVSTWRLGSLTGEHWLHDDVVDALLELLSLRLACKSFPDPSRYLILPVSFFDVAQQMYDNRRKDWGPALLQLRHILSTDRIRRIGFVVRMNNHYTAYYSDRSAILTHFDSLEGAPQAKVRLALNWVFSGVPNHLPINGFISRKPVMRQPLSGKGSGSCAIAALTTLGILMDPMCRTNMEWTPNTSYELRNRFMRQLVWYDECMCDDDVCDPTLSRWRCLIIFSPIGLWRKSPIPTLFQRLRMMLKPQVVCR
jgi:hypothetical protein